MPITTAKLIPPPPPPSERIVLEMDIDVARTLRTILMNISGEPQTTYRGHADELRDALLTIDRDFDAPNRVCAGSLAMAKRK